MNTDTKRLYIVNHTRYDAMLRENAKNKRYALTIIFTITGVLVLSGWLIAVYL